MFEKLPHLNSVNAQVRVALTAYKRRHRLDPWEELTEEQIKAFELEFCRQVVLTSALDGEMHLYTNTTESDVRGIADEYRKKMKIQYGAALTERERNEVDHYVARRLLERSVDDAEGI